MTDQQRLESVVSSMRKLSDDIAGSLILQMKAVATAIDVETRAGNFGNNVVVNVLAHALDTALTDMSTFKRTDVEYDRVYHDIVDSHQKFLHDVIARHSKSGALLVDLRKKKDGDAGGA